MPAVTYEFGGRNQKLRATLKDSADAAKDYRNKVKETFRSLNQEVAQSGKGGIFGGVLRANLATQGLMSLGRALGGVGREMGDLVDISDQLDVSVETLERLTRVMQGAGVSAGNLQKTFVSLAQQRQGALAGDEKAAEKFAAVGIQASELSKMSLEDVFFGVADGLAAIDDGGERAVRAMDLMGTRQAKLIGEMRKGSAELKAAMGAVSGAVGEEGARKIDTAGDKLEAYIAQAKGFLASKVVEGVESVMGGPERKLNNPFAGEKRVEQEKSVTKEKIAGAKAQLEAQKAEEERMRQMYMDLDRQAAAQKERADVMREQLGMHHRFASAVVDVMKARDNRDFADARGSTGEREQAILDEKRVVMERERAKMVERAGLPLAERKAAEKADREAERAKVRGERRFAAETRDKLDRAVRDGRMTDMERKKMLDELGADKNKPKAQNIEVQTLFEVKDIAKMMRKLGDKIDVAQ